MPFICKNCVREFIRDVKRSLLTIPAPPALA